jgi:hypothetical protein
MSTTKDVEKRESEASLPINHPKAGYVAPDLSAIEDRDPPDEGKVKTESLAQGPTSHSFNPADENTVPRTREENIAAREAEVKAVGEAEDKARKEEVQAEEKQAKEASTSTARPTS